MHELGVTFYVVDDVKKVAQENQISKVSSVTIELGEVSTVVPELLIDCWNWARKKEPALTECEMKIETIPAVTFCEDCKQEYDTVPNGKTCPNCGSGNTYLVTGNEVLLKEIVADD